MNLKIDGIWCNDEAVLKREASNFFKTLFQAAVTCEPNSLHLTNIPQITQDLKDKLLSPTAMREIRDALFSMDTYKAPGPDGFQPIFFKSYWEIVSSDLYDFIAQAFHHGKIEQHIAHTMIVPIPKVDAP